MALRQLWGRDALDALTALLQRCRLAHPTAGVWEAADLQWWWRLDQRADPADCVVWADADGPIAAVFATRFRDDLLADVVTLPDPAVAHELAGEITVAARRLVERHPARPVLWAVRDDDGAMVDLMASTGAVATEELMIAMWRDAAGGPTPPLPAGYTIERRSDQPAGSTHHLARRNGDDVAERLADTGLYRPDLDLLVRSPAGDVAAYALFWADPVTAVGLVEPVRVEDAHAGLGLAKALVAAGVQRLEAAGCERVKVSHMADNLAAAHAYAGAGFRPMATIRTHRSGT